MNQKRAVLYARVSGDDRLNSTSSLDSQLQMCREYAEQQDWEIVAELPEDARGASGASWDLPQLNNALDMAKEGRFDVLITREMDRLARNLAKQLVLEEEFKRLGVKVEYVIGDYRDTPEGQLNKHIRAVIADYERVKINERMVRGRRRKAEAGYVVLHGNTPYGYRAVKDEQGVRLEIDEETAEIVRMIYQWYVFEKWGAPNICRELNRLGIPPPSRAKKNVRTAKATNWNHSQPQRILVNETYAGKWRYGKRNKRGKNPDDHQIVVNVPAIISPELFEQAQKQREINRRIYKRPAKYKYLLRRRCICGECQAHMVSTTSGSKNKTYPYYRCSVRHQQVTHYATKTCTMTKHFSTRYWDQAVWQAIKEFLEDPTKLFKGLKQHQSELETMNEPLQARMNTLDDLLKQRRTELDRLLTLYLSGEFDKSLLIERKERLERTIEALQEEYHNLDEQKVQNITDQQIRDLEIYTQQIRKELGETDEDFETRCRLLDLLGVTVTFSIEDGREVADLRCEFGFEKRLLGRLITDRTLSHQPESGLSANSREEEGDKSMLNYMHSMDYRRS